MKKNTGMLYAEHYKRKMGVNHVDYTYFKDFSAKIAEWCRKGRFNSAEKISNQWHIEESEYFEKSVNFDHLVLAPIRQSQNDLPSQNATPRRKSSNSKALSGFSCPVCGGRDLKTAAVTVSAGTYSGESKISGVGVGTDGGLSVGFGKNNVTYQSDLAKSVKTVDEKNVGEQLGGCLGGAVGMVLGVVVGISSLSFFSGFAVMFICTFIGVIMGGQSGIGKADSRRIANDQANFSKTFVCQSCGHQFVKR